ncbi:shikimate kinase [Sphingomonas crocodyli]|uniref:Shikimate kinase n=2 Tax=Sphingomonas crocodyli TaxID=1979270 RepID=A0A437MBR9_9SPHN|nr:shikimate kinase [Sphingomonas crocodyli]
MAIPMHRRPVVLVGLMGAGKTTVGQRVATRLGLAFVDSDHEIECAAKRSISDLFELYGEQEFRDGERRVLARLIDATPKVIATGGGAFMNQETRSLILERGLAVWLDADIEVLVERTSRRPGHRPLLRNADAHAVLADLARARNPIYAQAHLHVRNEAAKHDAAVAHIVKSIRQLWRRAPSDIHSAHPGSRPIAAAANIHNLNE